MLARSVLRKPRVVTGVKELEAYNTQMRHVVQWGDMDCFQHVNNVIYFRYVENIRVHYFNRIGATCDYDAMVRGKQSQVMPILGHVDCKFIYPVTFPDELVLGVRTSKIVGNDKMYLDTKLYSLGLKRIVATSHGWAVAFDYKENKKVELPKEWIEGITREDEVAPHLEERKHRSKTH